jgi:drug/metabolite transporter (DMT)-like permease
MRMVRFAGIALIAAGAAILVWGNAFTDTREVLEAGGMTVVVEESRPIAPWAAAAVIVTGVLLTVIGMVDNRREA